MSMEYEIYMFDVTEESEDLTLKTLMKDYSSKWVYLTMNNELNKEHEWTETDCQIIANKLKKYSVNRELQYLVNHYRMSHKDAIIRLIDEEIIKMY